MATYATSAIIIGRYNFGEADRIIVLLTPDKGVIRGVAKGVRRIKSRLAGHLELFSHSDLMLVEGRNMDTITSARLKRHLAVGDDYERMQLAYLAAEMLSKLGGDDEQHDGLFQLADEFLSVLGVQSSSPELELWFKLRLLDCLGYRPQLDHCIVCDSGDPDRTYLFNAELGGIVDRGCSTPGNEPMTHAQIKLWRLMLANSFLDLKTVGGLRELAQQTLPICNQFYDYTFGRRFKAAEVLT